LKKIEDKQAKETEVLRKMESEAESAKQQEIHAAQNSVQLKKTQETELQASLTAKKQLDDSQKAAADAEKLK
jgi:hypothetical protein